MTDPSAPTPPTGSTPPHTPAGPSGGTATRAERSSVLRRAIGASAMGNATEWFDYGVYAYAAVYIQQVFFPSDNESTSALYTLLVFAVSFLVRPLGGLVLGPLGDRLGRSRVLAATIMMMAAATFLVGVLPSYETAGIWAPIAAHRAAHGPGLLDRR